MTPPPWDPSTPTVTTPAAACEACGAVSVSSFHGSDSCTGPILRVDNHWRCVECGVEISPSAACSACGAPVESTTATGQVTVRTPTPVSQLESTLFDTLSDFNTGTLSYDPLLAMIARVYSHDTIERTRFGGDAEISFESRIDAAGATLAGYQMQEHQVYPPTQEPTAVLDAIYEALEPFDAVYEWTHGGVGIACGPDGGLRVTAVVATRLAEALDPREIEAALHSAVNDCRQANDAAPIRFDDHLAGIARTYSRTMAQDDFFAHESPTGDTPADRYHRGGYNSTRAGENIAKRHPESGADPPSVAAETVEAWYDSPEHRDTMLADQWDVHGIGVFQAASGALLITQNLA